METSTQSTHRDEPLGFDSVLMLAGFLVRSLRRHPLIAAGGAALTLVAAVVALAVMPRIYRSEGRVLTRTAYYIPALVSSLRFVVPFGANRGTTGAIEVIRSRESLEKVVTRSQLAERWVANRGGLRRMMDAAFTLVFGPPDADALRDGLISMLEKRLYPGIDNDVIVFAVEWNDADTARLLVETAIAVFLDGRQNAELSELEDTVKLLERNLASARQPLQAAENNLRAVLTSRGAIRRVVPKRPPTAKPSNPILAELTEKRARVAKIQAEYDSRLAKAQEKMARLQESLGPSHPDMLQAAREVEEASRPPEELTQAQAETLRAELDLNRGDAQPFPADLEFTVTGTQVDPAVEQAAAEYRRARESFDQLRDRLADARVEAQTTKAAFQYRYIITQPPDRPNKPVKPRAIVVIGAGFAASIFVGLILALFFDLRTRRVIEAWMIDRIAGVPLLGEIEQP
jgi:uncharacterized protein involved in exopolysaccharide biosynthesis